MATLRFISDSAHGWLEVPTVDVAAAGVTPSRYSYIDATTGMTYLEEDCDLSRYAATISQLVMESQYIDGLCWVRDLPRCNWPMPSVYGPDHDATRWCHDMCALCESLWVGKMERDLDI